MTDGEARRWEWKLVTAAAAAVLMAVLSVTVFPTTLADSPPALPVELILHLAAATLLALAAVVLLIAGLHHRVFFSIRQRLRRDLGGPDGWLDIHDMRDTCGQRPVLAEAHTFWRQPTFRVEQAGWAVGEPISGRWPTRGKLMYAPYPRSAIVIGPQGSGKSQYAVPLILDAPAAEIVTSTKTELFDATAYERAGSHGPVYVFDVLDATGGEHNFPFDPVWGCTDAQRTDETAAAMIRGASINKRQNEEFWADVGREILRCYLLAAAVTGRSSFDVQRWSHDPDDPEPVEILTRYSSRVPHGWLGLLQTRIDTNVRQRDGYYATVASCMDFLALPGAAAACRAPAGVRFDMASFLAERCTLYIIGDNNVRGIASLMTALTEALAYEARQVAIATQRLAEPLVMVLDEVANLTPVDLPKWAAEFRGWGIMPIPIIQSRAQLDQVWGQDNGQIIWDNMVTKVVLPALGDEHFLESVSRLAGERKVRRTTDTTRGGGQGSIGLERVVPLHVIRSLPPFHAFVLGAPRHPAVVAYEPGFQRLERERSGAARRPAWPPWWRHPWRAVLSALELDRR